MANALVSLQTSQWVFAPILQVLALVLQILAPVLQSLALVLQILAPVLQSLAPALQSMLLGWSLRQILDEIIEL